MVREEVGYCATGFHGASLGRQAALLMTGAVCGRLGSSQSRSLSGPDRLFQLDPGLTVVASAALGLESERVFTHDDAIYASDRERTVLLDVSDGTLHDATAAQPFAAFGVVDLRGDGERVLVLGSREGTASIEGTLHVHIRDNEAIPVRGDGDGKDELLIPRLLLGAR